MASLPRLRRDLRGLLVGVVVIAPVFERRAPGLYQLPIASLPPQTNSESDRFRNGLPGQNRAVSDFDTLRAVDFYGLWQQVEVESILKQLLMRPGTHLRA